MEHTWPGNIRELENVLERCINVMDGKTIQPNHLPLYLRDQEPKRNPPNLPKPTINAKADLSSSPVQPLKETLALVEKQAIQQALAVTNGNKLEAAKQLGISKTSFYEKCKLYDVK